MLKKNSPGGLSANRIWHSCRQVNLLALVFSLTLLRVCAMDRWSNPNNFSLFNHITGNSHKNMLEIDYNLELANYLCLWTIHSVERKKKIKTLHGSSHSLFLLRIKNASLVLACEELVYTLLLTEAVPEVKTAEHMEAAAFGHQKW